MMRNFSNRSFIQAITPQVSSQSGKLIGWVLIACFSSAAVLLLYQCYNYSKQLQGLKKQNKILTGQLEAALAVAEVTGDHIDEDETSQDTVA